MPFVRHSGEKRKILDGKISKSMEEITVLVKSLFKQRGDRVNIISTIEGKQTIFDLLDLSLYEVGTWLDWYLFNYDGELHFEKISSVYLDERKWNYLRPDGYFISFLTLVFKKEEKS